ncbi:alanyl-tRNA synthetase [Capsaspora owczarzaki ATCC 30864]|uniref:Alanine--tRNA ligase n=1 Tax=Capsaspora owczarzaki (strain ATCC 30864) TaxID=595528 RepID=A0A0D2X4Q5_CAPO3|nr:alanyl-tRNA synthetase [Capsaspora owczarzaki ATCC 30864]KJE96469.1 alanyl-tRNA synthetase [Capsaspora owczarzaki ATCC 30864]|eukprot:XP_011270692.1 alanyl-tRNA synthetase [Capsaspora owczarzaki ATCC 30864]
MSVDWTTAPASAVRQQFVDFFVSKGHEFVPSSSVIPHDDPTLLFANAGMNQFKPAFLGTADPNSRMAKYRRTANSQKCIRAGGKHNDLEDVGKDVYHHTFFEMLGNWSFGDYFKKEAISWAWELLTVVYKLDPNRLYVTYFGGNEKAGLEADLEARDIWLSVGLPAERVLPYGMKENFWEMGETGPCGPCSEIHFDRIGGGRDAAALVNADDPDVLEIWNLVFIQFNREVDQSLRKLPRCHVDTGMGLERIVSVLQNKRSNYDTDVFVPYFTAIQAATGIRAYTGKVGADDTDGLDMAYRVVADHIRTLTIALADGGAPGPTGRDYVLRRVLRRAVRYCAEKLGAKPGFFASLVDVVGTSLGGFFPELVRSPQDIKDIINEEEAQFRKTLDRGKRLFERAAAASKNGVIEGLVAWRLYDTYGFPLDLTELMAAELKLTIDKPGFKIAEADAKEASKGKVDEAEETVVLDVHNISALKDKGVPATDDSPKFNYRSENDKYTFESAVGSIVAIALGKELVSTVDFESLKGAKVGIVLDKTNFYAEQGGQIFDTGFATRVDNEASEFAIESVKVYGPYVLHVGRLQGGSLSIGDKLTLSIDDIRRLPIMANHTTTHMLNFALREVLGNSVDQKGSLVRPDNFRFDFSHPKAVSTEELRKIEKIVNDIIEKNETVYRVPTALHLAKEVAGLRAVFDEVYPDPVRVVSVGVPVEKLLADPASASWKGYSIEFCGGTHIDRTRDARRFAIFREEGIAKGIRRISGITGKEAIEAYKTADKLEAKVKQVSEIPIGQLGRELPSLIESVDTAVIPSFRKDEIKAAIAAISKRVSDHEKAQQAEQTKIATAAVKERIDAGAPFVVAFVDINGNRKAMSAGLSAAKDAAGLLVSKDGDSIIAVASVPKALVGKIKAGEWVTEAVKSLSNTKTGGADTVGQASGTGSDHAAVIDAATKFAAARLQ